MNSYNELRSQAKDFSVVSDIGIFGGAACLAAAGILWFTAPSHSDSAVRTGLYVAPGVAFGTVQGSF